ncbi:hypothetical protein HK22_13005 [Gluconobacter sp. DsW_056]|uniref:hypothetical protein n=1 Tax=Gluconobacter sp. DsW_056 TaxID=1511209 RepID=UPI000A39EE85|nr:hypothetical protein [Gluconobacter sp. DsW_056]OUI82061.1 hypothetical protein HK22_13005 [Gluconobacter sp. DsW_056]
MKTRLLHAAALTGLVALACMASPARADHPWQDSAAQASITADAALPGLRSTTLLAGKNGTYLALDSSGHPVRIDATNTSTPLSGPDVPTEPLVFLTVSGNDLWGLSTEKMPTLIRMSMDGAAQSRLALTGATVTGSNLVALQIHGAQAYLADEGKPALVVADLKTGTAKRFLSYDMSLIGRHPLLRAGEPRMGPDGRPMAGGNVRFLLLDTKGQWLFYQPACGPMSRIDTALLTDTDFTPVEQLDGITEWRTTPSIGGETLTPDNIFYLSDITVGSILKFGSDRIPLRIIRDPRLYDAGAPAVPDSHQMAVLATEDGTTHILRIALP